MDFFITYETALQSYLVISFGLVVLIWLVQLIIYPNFQYLPDIERTQWHKVYTPRITAVVAPLMILQFLFAASFLFFNISLFTVSSILLILLNWILTFFYFVPLHVKLDKNKVNYNLLKGLVNMNWYRTGLWSLIFLIALAKVVLT